MNLYKCDIKNKNGDVVFVCFAVRREEDDDSVYTLFHELLPGENGNSFSGIRYGDVVLSKDWCKKHKVIDTIYRLFEKHGARQWNVSAEKKEIIDWEGELMPDIDDYHGNLKKIDINWFKNTKENHNIANLKLSQIKTGWI